MFASFGQDLKIHEFGSGRQLAGISPAKDGDYFRSVMWSTQGKRLLGVTSDGTAMLITIQDENGSDEIMCQTISNIPPVNAACLCKTISSHILFGTEIKQVFLYDLQEQAIKQQFEDLPDAVILIDISATDTYIAVGCRNGQIFLFESFDKMSSSYFVHNSKSLSTISFHPLLDNILAGASSEGNLTIWDVKDDVAIFNFEPEKAVIAMRFDDGGTDIVFADCEKNVYIFDYYTKDCKASFQLLYDISGVYRLKDTTELILSTSCGRIFKFNYKTEKGITMFKKEDGYCITGLAFLPMQIEPVPQNRFNSGCGDISTANSATTLSIQKPTKVTSKWIKSNDNQIKNKKIGMKAYHIVDSGNIDGLYTGISSHTKDLYNTIVTEMNNQFLKIRMDISRIFCIMERRERARWHEFNNSLLKLVDNETEVDVEFIGNSGNDIINIH